MKKQISCICAAAVIAACGASCGSRPASKSGISVSVETITNVSNEEHKKLAVGNWETAREYLNGAERDKSELIYNRYTFSEDGSGIYYTPDGEKQQISWEITPDGGLNLLYEEKGETTEYYDFIGCDLVLQQNTEDGVLDTYIAKVAKFTKAGDIE